VFGTVEPLRDNEKKETIYTPRKSYRYYEHVYGKSSLNDVSPGDAHAYHTLLRARNNAVIDSIGTANVRTDSVLRLIDNRSSDRWKRFPLDENVTFIPPNTTGF